MDEIVKQAMAKWPNVPHCYGWLMLDARGNWRMRDERTQALNLPGDRISNPALLAFIHRNYTHDAQGRWYFQNGPQRVYVNLEATPFIARTDPAHGFVLHNGEALKGVEAAWLTESGLLLLKQGEHLALLDDRDMAQCLSRLFIDDSLASDDEIMAWLEAGETGKLWLDIDGGRLPVGRIRQAEMPSRFGYLTHPQPDA